MNKLQAAFPDRFIDVGIAEQHAVTLAAGLALAGMRPVVALYSTFLQRAFDQTVLDVCQNDTPVILAAIDLYGRGHWPGVVMLVLLAAANVTTARGSRGWAVGRACPFVGPLRFWPSWGPARSRPSNGSRGGRSTRPWDA